MIISLPSVFPQRSRVSRWPPGVERSKACQHMSNIIAKHASRAKTPNQEELPKTRRGKLSNQVSLHQVLHYVRPKYLLWYPYIPWELWSFTWLSVVQWNALLPLQHWAWHNRKYQRCKNTIQHNISKKQYIQQRLKRFKIIIIIQFILCWPNLHKFSPNGVRFLHQYINDASI